MKYYLISNNNQIKNIKLKLIIIYINYLLYFNSIIIIKFKYIQKYLIYINFYNNIAKLLLKNE